VKAAFDAICNTNSYLTPDLWPETKFEKSPYQEHTDWLKENAKETLVKRTGGGREREERGGGRERRPYGRRDGGGREGGRGAGGAGEGGAAPTDEAGTGGAGGDGGAEPAETAAE